MMQLEMRKSGILDDRIYKAISSLSRKNFLPENLTGLANEDSDLEIFDNIFATKTTDIAKMINIALLLNSKTKNVLEIGTGSGWQTALLSKIYERVYSIEINEKAFLFSNKNLKNVGGRIFTKLADGKYGWEESSPYDAIYIDLCCEDIPESLIEQLNKKCGVLVFIKKHKEKQYFHSFCTNGNLGVIRTPFEVQRSNLE
tara:strand:+ start:11737 stop:12336 length:600 start_codon:yes stop_codon:yes gene_type:complete